MMGRERRFVERRPAANRAPHRIRTMKFPRLILGLALLAPFAAAQAKTQEQLAALRDEKLGKKVFTRAEWSFDFDEAMENASGSGKPILAYFTRSYAHSGPCDALESGLLSSPEFVEFAKSVVLFVHVTSHCEDDDRPHLLRELGFVSHPSLCFLDAEGKVTVRSPQRDVPSLVRSRDLLLELDGLRAAAEEGDEDAPRGVFLCEVELGMLTSEQIRQRMGTFELDEEERAMVDQALVDLEVRELRSKTRELGADTVGKKMADMARAGRKPSADGSQFFWQMVLSWCAKNSDAALAQRAFDELSGQKAPPQMIERNRALLEQAKSGGK